jgi:TatD DNase family protein
MTAWIDTHAHLHWPDFDALESVLERARAAGVVHVVSLATDRESCRAARRLRERSQTISVGYGIHPNDCGSAQPRDFEEVEAMLREGDAVSVGETGLDFYRDRAPREAQEALFRRHLAVARDLDLPVVVHCRESFAACVEAIREFPGVRGVFHCFSEGAKEAEIAVGLGFHVSFAGNLAYPNSEAIREAAACVPADRVLVETDAPFLTPPPHRGKRRNEPAFVALTGAALASVRGVSPQEAAAMTTRNARALFRLAGGPDGA